MAADYVPSFLVVITVLFIKETETLNVTEDSDTVYNVTSHLKLEIVQKYCLHRDDACKSDGTNVCAVKMKNETKFHKDFQNECYLFLSNMCDYPGEEYYLVSESSCEQYLTRRRSNEVEDETNSIAEVNSSIEMNSTIETNSSTEVNSTIETNSSNEENSTIETNSSTEVNSTIETGSSTEVNSTIETGSSTEVNSTIETGSSTEVNSTTENNSGDKDTVTAAAALREGSSETEDSKEWSFDNHVCPYSCPDTYVPECLSVNSLIGGKYFRMFYFINHCLADDYYCKHWKEFPVVEYDEEEDVASSPISWTKCASSRFIQFSRFAEAASSMAHYGWLAGSYKATHIMEPHQRIPGFG